MRKQLFSAGLLALIALGGLPACKSSGGSSETVATPDTTTSETETVYGIAATGAPIRGRVFLFDLGGSGKNKLTDISNASGRYEFNVSDLKGPFLIKAVSSESKRPYYSFGYKQGKSTRINANPFTHLGMAITCHTILDSTDPKICEQNRDRLANLDANDYRTNMQKALSLTSSTFKSEALKQNIDIGSKIDPAKDEFIIGKGLDKALDSVSIEYRNDTGEIIERIPGSTDIINVSNFPKLAHKGKSLQVKHDTDAASIPTPIPSTESAQTSFSAILNWDDATQNAVSSVNWSIVDCPKGGECPKDNPETTSTTDKSELASIDATGKLTVKRFSGDDRKFKVIATYMTGGEILLASREITAKRYDLSKLTFDDVPEQVSSGVELTINPTASWEVSVGVETKTTLDSSDSVTVSGCDPSFCFRDGKKLIFSRVNADKKLTLNASFTVNSKTQRAEKTITVKAFVHTPQEIIGLDCPIGVAAGGSGNCLATVRFSDDSLREMTPQLVIDDSSKATVTGNTISSHWHDPVSDGSVKVTASISGVSGKKQSVIALYHSTSKLQGIRIDGLSSMREGGSVDYVAKALWDDNSETDVSRDLDWSVASSGNIVSNDGLTRFKATYIWDKDQLHDHHAVVTARCDPNTVYGKGHLCYDPVTMATRNLSKSVDLTVLYAKPAVAKAIVRLRKAGSNDNSKDNYPDESLFLEAGKTHNLGIEVTYDKLQTNGAPQTSWYTGNVQWTAEHPNASSNGDAVTIGAENDEPLLPLEARFTDAYGVEQRVYALATIVKASTSPVGRFDNQGYYVRPDGLMQRLHIENCDSEYCLADFQNSSPYLSNNSRRRFISTVSQHLASCEGRDVFVRQDGALWRDSRIADLPLPADSLLLKTLNWLKTHGAGDITMLPRKQGSLGNDNAEIAAIADCSVLVRKNDGSLKALHSDGSSSDVLKQPEPTQPGEQKAFVTQLIADNAAADKASVMLRYNTGELKLISQVASYNGDGQEPHISTLVAPGIPLPPSGAATLPKFSSAAMVSGDKGFVLAVSDSNALYSWGYNDNWQLANNSVAKALQPQLVKQLKDIVSVYADNEGSRAFALLKDGKIWRWGNKTLPVQMDSTWSSTPERIVVRKQASGRDVLFVLQDSTVWAQQQLDENQFRQLYWRNASGNRVPFLVNQAL